MSLKSINDSYDFCVVKNSCIKREFSEVLTDVLVMNKRIKQQQENFEYRKSKVNYDDIVLRQKVLKR